MDYCVSLCPMLTTPQCLPLLTAYQACVRGRALDCAQGGRGPAECAAVERAFLEFSPCTQGGSTPPPSSDGGKDPLPDDAG